MRQLKIGVRVAGVTCFCLLLVPRMLSSASLPVNVSHSSLTSGTCSLIEMSSPSSLGPTVNMLMISVLEVPKSHKKQFRVLDVTLWCPVCHGPDLVGVMGWK